MIGCFWEKIGDWSAVSEKGPGIGGLFLRKLVIGRLFVRKDRGLVGCWVVSEMIGNWSAGVCIPVN